MDKGYDRGLRQLGRKHDLISCVIQDHAELEIPDMGLIELEDGETGERFTVDTSSSVFRKQYETMMRAQKNERDVLLKRAQVERIDIDTSKDFVDPLAAFFRRRNKK